MIKSIFQCTFLSVGLFVAAASLAQASTVTGSIASSAPATTSATTTTLSALATTTIATSSSSKASTTTSVATTTPAVSRADSEKAVRSYFADIPAMIEVARCESNFRQFTDAGNVFHDASGRMVGVFQFNWVMHNAQAQVYGFDIATLDGNMKYARHLYEAQGISPWQSCAPVAPVLATLDEQTQLKIKIITQLIGLLQQLLAMQAK